VRGNAVERCPGPSRGTMCPMDPFPVIIKLGDTLPELAAQKGDFEDWILRGMGLTRSQVRIVDPTRGEALPAPGTIAGAVLTGSHAMVTDHVPWSERTASWLRDIVAVRVPVLGICYGHQLLAYALGGEVGPNPHGSEMGTVEAWLTEAGQADSLLGDLEDTIHVHASHAQTVLRLPKGATLLATSAMDRALAFALDGSVWGVQFHPEFDAEIGRAYIRAEAETLAAGGQDPERLITACVDAPAGTAILARFARLVQTRQP